MKFVSFQTSDKKDVAEFFKSIFKEMGWNVLYTDKLNDSVNCFHLPDNGALLLVKDKSNLVATAGIVKLNNKEGLIKRFYLVKDYRGTGTAQKLLQALYKQAKKMNLSRLVLDVSNTNHRAIHFYEKSGFTKYIPEPILQWSESQSPDHFRYYYREI